MHGMQILHPTECMLYWIPNGLSLGTCFMRAPRNLLKAHAEPGSAFTLNVPKQTNDRGVGGTLLTRERSQSPSFWSAGCGGGSPPYITLSEDGRRCPRPPECTKPIILNVLIRTDQAGIRQNEPYND